MSSVASYIQHFDALTVDELSLPSLRCINVVACLLQCFVCDMNDKDFSGHRWPNGDHIHVASCGSLGLEGGSLREARKQSILYYRFTLVMTRKFNGHCLVEVYQPICLFLKPVKCGKFIHDPLQNRSLLAIHY